MRRGCADAKVVASSPHRVSASSPHRAYYAPLLWVFVGAGTGIAATGTPFALQAFAYVGAPIENVTDTGSTTNSAAQFFHAALVYAGLKTQ